MHHSVFGINFLLHSISLILITLHHTLLIQPTPVHLSNYYHCHHCYRLLLLLFFISDSKPTFSRNLSRHRYPTQTLDFSTVFSFSFLFIILYVAVD